MKTNMKKLLVIALALMPSLSINTFAQDGGEGGGTIPPGSDEPLNLPLIVIRPRLVPDVPIPIPITPAPNPFPNPGPRSTAQLPHCYYQDGVVSIDADSSIIYINAYVIRSYDNLVWTGTASGNTLSIAASSDSGEYFLKLTLSDGQSYQGKYIIE